jgi:putative membrane protein
MGLLLRILLYTASVWIAVWLIDGLNFTGSWSALLGIGVILAAVNTFIRPVAKLLSLPLITLTLGLFVLVVNALMFWLTIWISGQLDLGLTADGALPIFLGALVVSIVVWIGEALTKRR